MKKMKQALGICLALVMVVALALAPASAATILGTKDTEYGTITASILYQEIEATPTYPWIGYTFNLATSINSSVTMRKTTTSWEAMYRDTGLPGANGAWSGTHSTTNSNSDNDWFNFYGETGREVLIYTSHQVSYTTSYVLYTVNSYCLDGYFPELE